MSLIEQAAKRLEELRRAGAEMPADASVDAPSGDAPVRSAAEHVPTPEAAGPRSSDARTASRAAAAPRVRRLAMHRPHRCSVRAARAGTSSRRVASRSTSTRLKNGGFVTPDAPKSQIADEFRVIKRPIIRNALGALGHADPRIGISSW